MTLMVMMSKIFQNKNNGTRIARIRRIRTGIRTGLCPATLAQEQIALMTGIRTDTPSRQACHPSEKRGIRTINWGIRTGTNTLSFFVVPLYDLLCLIWLTVPSVSPRLRGEPVPYDSSVSMWLKIIYVVYFFA
jgi:hypothetical protein